MMHSFDAATQKQIDLLRQNDPFADLALQQLDRMLASVVFSRLHDNAKGFLVFIVVKALLGQQDQIKENTVAVSVYNEPTDFRPVETSKVRTAGTGLRKRVALYNNGEGRRDPIRIALPDEGYVPSIRDRRISVAVHPLENWNPDGGHGHFSGGLASEVVDHLNETGWITAAVTAGSPILADFAVRGSVEVREDVLRVNVSVGQIAAGRILASELFEDHREHAFGLARRITHALIDVFEIHVDGDSPIRRSPSPARVPARAALRTRKRTRKMS